MSLFIYLWIYEYFMNFGEYVDSMLRCMPSPAFGSRYALVATLYETIHALHLYGFNIVCDGASSNMATIKQLTGFGSGPYGAQEAPIMCDDIASTPHSHEVKAWFLNPHTNEKVYTLICPSHQVSETVSFSAGDFSPACCLEQFNFVLSLNVACPLIFRTYMIHVHLCPLSLPSCQKPKETVHKP